MSWENATDAELAREYEAARMRLDAAQHTLRSIEREWTRRDAEHVAKYGQDDRATDRPVGGAR